MTDCLSLYSPIRKNDTNDGFKLHHVFQLDQMGKSEHMRHLSVEISLRIQNNNCNGRLLGKVELA